jgi:trimethylamine--corrinoid protein Co-methyltransferase
MSEPIVALPHTRRLDVLPGEALEAIHRETLEVLERVGIGLAAADLSERLGQAGARVDGSRVRFPAAMVEEAVAAAPSAYSLASRRDGEELALDGRHGYLAVDGCAAEILDLESGERRPSTLDDLAMVSRLADALPEISILWQPVAARDVPQEIKSLYELRAQLANSTKHIQMMTAVTPTMARGVVEIARCVAGGEDELRRRPILSAFQCSLSPLGYEAGALEAALVLAGAGVPCGFVVMPIAGATAPVTVRGALVQTNAEVLAGITVLEALAPGSATFYGACTTVMDLRTGAAACGGPEDLFFQMAAAQLARRYEVPSSIGTFATGAKSPDWQGGLENGLSALASSLANADMVCGAGLLDAASLHSPEQLVLDCETFRLVSHLASLGRSVAEADARIDVLDEVGPGGHFLSHPQTLERMREQWMPQLFDRRSWDEFTVDADAGPRRTAADRARELLASHEPEPLDEDLDHEIGRIIESFEREGDPTHG